MKYKKILLTGGTGKLGSAIQASEKFKNLYAPDRSLLDITVASTITKFFSRNPVDAVIHCAALARIGICQADPIAALSTNIIGTCNLVMEVLRQEVLMNKNIRFIHISTDGVYPGKTGLYSERDAAIPYNHYGWTKLGAECAVNLLTNFCIIRTSFFDPNNIPFEESAADAFSSKLPLNELIDAISKIMENDFVGTINIGGERKSEYIRYKEYKPQIKECTFEDICDNVLFPLAKDASMDCTQWQKLTSGKFKE